jgi:hypothetical protein
MLVSGINVTARDNYCELRANVRCETHWVWGDDPFTLWYRFPIELEQYLDPENGDPFVAAFLAPAMVLGESLKIEAPVSPTLMKSAGEIQSLYKNWYPSLAEVQLDAPLSPPKTIEQSGAATGLFFSLGADSFYSLVKNLRDHADDVDSITHLVTVEGFDVYLWESERYPAVLSNFERVSQQLGKSALHVATNLRDFSDRVADWVNLYHGGALASVGLSLQKLFTKMLIASTHRDTNLMPLGSHPLLDPLWSTERISFVHDGGEASRLDKLRLIAATPLALETLRVCAISEESDVYNCGKCPKCLMTMVGLHIVGRLKNCKTLPAGVDANWLRGISVKNATQRIYLQELADALGKSSEDMAIRAALEYCLGRADIKVLAAI